MVLAGWHETLACRWISGQYVMSQKASKSNSLNSLNQFWPLNLLRFSAISTKILMHVDVIIKDLLHVLGQKRCPCKLPQRAFVLSLDEQKYCMWTHPLQCPFLSNQTCLFLHERRWYQHKNWWIFLNSREDHCGLSLLCASWIAKILLSTVEFASVTKRQLSVTFNLRGGFQEPMKMREERHAIWWSLT